MKTIIDKETGLLLYCRPDEPTESNELAISEMCTLENPDNLEIYYNFETQEFYTK
jgi:hypothetical protein